MPFSPGQHIFDFICSKANAFKKTQHKNQAYVMGCRGFRHLGIPYGIKGLLLLKQR